MEDARLLKSISKDSSCPCGNTSTYHRCCAPLHLGAELASSAESLMRSRYTAYVLGNIDYLFESHAPAERGTFDREAAQRWHDSTTWLGLKIVNVESGVHGDHNPDRAGVEFIARYREDGELCRHHEHSHFRCIDGRWYYEGGHAIENAKPHARTALKVGRNEPCPCGSKKKYKKCCAA